MKMNPPRPNFSSDLFKALLVVLIAAFVIPDIVAQEEPIFIIQTSNKIKARSVSAPDQTIKVQAGAALMSGAKVKLDKKEELLVLNEGEFQWVSGEGVHVLEHKDEATQMMAFNFDPTFAEYLKASYAITMSNIAPDRFDLSENKNLGDGWGVTGGGGTGGWGVTGGSGTGGWGVTGGGGTGGWGVTGGGGTGGWGVTGGGGTGGWGIQNPDSWGGWGVSDPTGTGAWGVTGGGGTGGWGVTGGGGTGGWGTINPTTTKGWGVTGGGGTGGWGVTGGGGTGGWGTEAGDSTSTGWIKEDMTIFSMIPGGKYQKGNNVWAWIGHKDVEEYLVCIFNDSLDVVHAQVSNTPRTNVDLSKFEEGKPYYWQVFAKDKRAISTPISFNVISNQEYLEIRESSSFSDIYSKAGPAIQGLMQAAAFETNKLYAESKKVFDKLIDRYPKNDLVRMCYAAYAMRMGQPLEAKKNIEKI
jgi:hypothetical protein